MLLFNSILEPYQSLLDPYKKGKRITMKKAIYKNISELKTFTYILALATLIVGLSACEQVTEVIQSSTRDQRNEISIGLVLPLTGHLAPAGKLMKEGYDLALDEINAAQIVNTQLKFIVEDSTSTPEGAVADFNKLIHEDGVSIIIGPASSSATKAAFPIARDNQIVAISSTSGARGLGEISDFVFRVALTTDVVAPRGVKTTHAKLRYQRVATLYDETDVFSSDRESALQQAFTEYNIEALTPEIFQSGDTDFSEQLTRIKEGNPDAVFVSALPPEKPGILIQARELGIAVPFIVSSLTDVEVQAAGDAAEGAITFIGWLPTDDTPGNRDFVQKYTATYGMVPNAFATASYTTVYILAEAIRSAPSTDATAIRDALANIKDFDTVFGKFSFNADGDADYEPKVLIVQDGTLQPFE